MNTSSIYKAGTQPNRLFQFLSNRPGRWFTGR